MCDVHLLCRLHFSDKKSEQAKDMHLVKRLTTMLRSRDVDPGEDHRSENPSEMEENPTLDQSCFTLLFMFQML